MHGQFLNLCTAIAVTSLMATSVRAQNENTEIVSENTTELQVKAMIAKLASSSFAERQQATKDLNNVGPESVALLEMTALASTGETQLRLSMILPQLRKRLFDDQLQTFLEQPSIEFAQRLPQWERFEKLSGHDKKALEIFGEIMAAEPRLFASRLFASRDLPALLERRTAELAKACNGLQGEEFPIASVSAVMLLASESNTRLIRATSTNISVVFDEPRFSELITVGVHAKTCRGVDNPDRQYRRNRRGTTIAFFDEARFKVWSVGGASHRKEQIQSAGHDSVSALSGKAQKYRRPSAD